jgi:hypothetical protein
VARVAPGGLEIDPALSLTGFDVVTGMIAADIDGDGHRDVVLESAQGGVAVVFWSPSLNTLDGSTLTKLSLADLDAVCHVNPPLQWGVALATLSPPDGSLAQPLVVARPGGWSLVGYDGSKLTALCLPFSLPASALAAGDFDGDGIEDIMASEKGSLVVFYGDAHLPGGLLASSGGAQ